MIERFYPKGDATGEAVQALSSGLTLYNDLQFRKKAEELRSKLAEMTPGSEEFEAGKTMFEAYRANIQNEELRLKDAIPAFK